MLGPSVQSAGLQKECSGLKPWLGSTICFGARHFALLMAVSTQVVIEMFKLFNDLRVHCNTSVQQLLTDEILVLWQCIYFQF